MKSQLEQGWEWDKNVFWPPCCLIYIFSCDHNAATTLEHHPKISL